MDIVEIPSMAGKINSGEVIGGQVDLTRRSFS